ncbi:MAG: DNA-binding protein [Deltaproteobacteria bacterium]|nr:DNA-binding protein [Deltaproteobacteria bacterium]
MQDDSLLAEIGSQKVERMVQFRVKEGSDLLKAIGEAVKTENIQNGVIVSGLGALKKAVFRNLKRFPDRFPVKPEDRLYLELEKPMELVSLVGWIAVKEDGVPEIHAHFSASTVEGDNVVTLGGHLTEDTITGIKVVISILVLEPGSLYAGFDESTQTYDLGFKSRTI